MCRVRWTLSLTTAILQPRIGRLIRQCLLVVKVQARLGGTSLKKITMSSLIIPFMWALQTLTALRLTALRLRYFSQVTTILIMSA